MATKTTNKEAEALEEALRDAVDKALEFFLEEEVRRIVEHEMNSRRA